MGVQPTEEHGHPYDGFIPVTPIMDTQLDDLVIRDLLAPLTAQFLKRLKAKIDERKSENWMEIHFAMFIMMSNIGWIVKDMIAMTTWKGLKVSTSSMSFPGFPSSSHCACTCMVQADLASSLVLVAEHSLTVTYMHARPCFHISISHALVPYPP
jgi:hypothetical protein